MAVNFRLAYNSGLNIVDLFPSSNMKAVDNTDDIMQYSFINVTIPPPSNQANTQSISISTTSKQVSAPVYMFLNSSGEQAMLDYLTISQFQVTNNQLILTRLYSWPEENINVTLLFEEVGV